MSLHPIDRDLIQQCLGKQPQAWRNFVDRFLGLVVHVIRHSATSRGIRLAPQDSEDFAAEVFLGIVENDYAVLRRFKGESSLATYLTVVARRIVVREILKRKNLGRSVDILSRAAQGESRTSRGDERSVNERIANERSAEERIGDRDEIERLLRGLAGAEADVVRMYHLEGKSYQEISSKIGMPENSIGPTLSRAREKLRRSHADSPVR